jgi:hypothetical protein
VHGVEREQAPAEAQRRNHLLGGGDLVALLGNRQMAENDLSIGGKGAQHMRRLAVVESVEAAAQGLAVDGHRHWRARPHPDLEFPTRPRDRLAVTSWPFRAYIDSQANRGRKPSVPSMDIKEFPAMVVERFAVYNVNPLLNHFRSTDSVYLESFREAVAKARSHIVDLGPPGRCFATTGTRTAEAAVRDGCKWIDIAAAIGSPSVWQHLSAQQGEKPNLDAAAINLTRLADYGGKRNVVVNLENDNPTAEDRHQRRRPFRGDYEAN